MTAQQSSVLVVNIRKRTPIAYKSMGEAAEIDLQKKIGRKVQKKYNL